MVQVSFLLTLITILSIDNSFNASINFLIYENDSFENMIGSINVTSPLSSIYTRLKLSNYKYEAPMVSIDIDYELYDLQPSSIQLDGEKEFNFTFDSVILSSSYTFRTIWSVFGIKK